MTGSFTNGPALDSKYSKAEANYSKGKPGKHCSLCKHFDKDTDTCEVVEGEIRPAMWCRFFVKAK